MGTLREPGCLNAYLERCHANIPPAGYILNVALRGAFRPGPGLTLLPASSAAPTSRRFMNAENWWLER